MHQFNELTYYQSEDEPNTFFFIPGAPTPRRNEHGDPSLSLIVFSAGSMLQLNTRWDVDEAVLETLRKVLAREHDVDNPALIRLSPAPLEVGDALLLLGEGSGELEVLQTRRTSGFYPYDALFNVTLTAYQQEQVTAALSGEHNHLKVRYEVTHPLERTVTVILSGDVRQDVAELRAAGDEADLAAQVEAALAADRLQETREGDAEASEAVWQEAAQATRTRMAEVLAALLAEDEAAWDDAGWDAADVEVSATRSETEARTLDRITDVADWFPEGEGEEYILVTGTGEV
jgi:hypothetical protein